MNAMRIGLFCALVGWMATDAQAQLGTFASPDPIPLGQYAPRDSYPPAMAYPTSYVAAANGPALPPAPAPINNVPQPPTESTAVAGMLNEPCPPVNPASGCNMMPAGGYMQNAGKCDARGDVCGGGNGCDSHWYGGVDALFMTRSKPNMFCTSINMDGWTPSQGSGFNEVNWTWGEQVTGGYRFGCNNEWAIEGTFWNLTESCTDGAPENIPSCPYVSPMNFKNVDILGTCNGWGTNGCQTADSYINNSPNNHIWLNWMAENVEFNLVRSICGGNAGCQYGGGSCGGAGGCGSCGGCGGCGGCGCGDCNRFAFDFLAGIRWFRFQDGYLFGAQRCADGSAYAGDWLYIDDRITNDLVGFQIGFDACYHFADCWKVFLRPEFGIYDNHMTLDYNLYAQSCSGGGQYQASSQTCGSQNYPVHAESDGFAFLTQVDLGLDWQFTKHVGAQLGYRVIAVTGMAMSNSQIATCANDTQSIADIKHDDSLLLHGAFGGLTFTW